ncbi:glycosyltransferase family 2 protein [Lachnospiraceae bacterium 54-11]
MDSLYIIMPAYNEEENIGKVIEEWYPIVERYSGNGKSRLIIIDDGSRDGTYEVMRKFTENRPLFVPLTKKNEGHGATVLFGYHYALKNNADYIFQTDSDGQTIPGEFDKFWEMRKSSEVIIGNRNHREDGISRIFVTKVLKFVLKIVFGINVIDANCPYRLMTRNVLMKYLPKVPEKFNLSNVLLTVLFVKEKAGVVFVPITFRERQGGTNSINMKSIIKIGLQAVVDFQKIRKGL